MLHEFREFADAESLASAAADVITDLGRRRIGEHGVFNLAVSGGRTPSTMLRDLAQRDLDWACVRVFQVDERIAAPGGPERNLTALRDAMTDTAPTIMAMPVNDVDLEAAAERYASMLPARFDLVHLGLGPDGHTASLVPGDPDLEVTDRLVAISGPYQGTRRMTLTYRALARADEILWLVSGADKRVALAQLRSGDVTIPAGRVEAARSLIMADRSASA